MKQQTQLVNALRGHAAEFGVIAAKGTGHIEALLERIAADPAVPAAAQAVFVELGERIGELTTRLAAIDRKLAMLHKTNPVSQRLAEVPGVGPINALTLALTVDARQFQSGRHFAAWLGLTPKQNSTAGKPRLGKISREGNERLRQLLVLGATSVVKHVKPEAGKGSAWLQQGNRVKEYVTKRRSAESMTILDSVCGGRHGWRDDGRSGIRRNGCFLESPQRPAGPSPTWQDQLSAR